MSDYLSINDNPETLVRLDVGTIAVHLSTRASSARLQQILERAPNLKKIRLTPSLHEVPGIPQVFLPELHRRGIELEVGYTGSPAHVASNMRPKRGREFRRKRDFLINLDTNGKKKLAELQHYGLDYAEIMLSYYGIDGREPRTLRELLKIFPARRGTAI